MKMKMKIVALASALLFGIGYSSAQDTLMFNYTGGVQTLTIPPCASQVSVEMVGGSGGAQGPNMNQGLGAMVSGILTVPPGSTIEINVGGAGGCGAGSGGFNGGGSGANGTQTYIGCGGGGASDIRVAPYTLGDRIAVAAGGGGEGGGNGSYNPSAGDGGCNTGGQSTLFSWGDHGFGGTQAAGGAGGAAWGSGAAGSAGSFGQGGAGATDPCFNTGPGGGGGGGYYGGGGGGSDCWGGGGSLGGGGGGGGSSLTPLGGNCTAGVNDGDGYVMIIIDGCQEPTICAGDTAQIDMTDAIAGFTVTGYSWAPAAGVADPNGGPIMDVFPTDSVIYTVTVTHTTGSFTVDYPVHVVQPIEPDAGLDDSLCHNVTAGAMLNGTLYNDGVYSWSFNSATTFSGGPGSSIFNPGNNVLNPEALVNLPGYYEFFLTEEDTNGVCPDGVDTVFVYFSTESHTTAFTDPICFGSADGTITIDSDVSAASGNLGASNYSVDGGVTWQTSNVFTGLTSGTYDVVSEDYLGCQFTSQVTLTDPPAITMSPSSDTTICQNGTATLVAQGNNAPAGVGYTYNWSEGTSTTETNAITPAPAGTNMAVDVYVVTDDGCVSDTVTYNIDHYDPITALITANDTVCPGYDAQHQVYDIIGGLNGYNYSWTANGSPMVDIDDVIDINPTVNTQYCVTVSDVCETTPIELCTDVIMRTVPDVVFGDPFDGCVPSEVTLYNYTNNVTIDSVNWYINGVYYQGATYNDSVTVTLVDVAEYDVTLEVYSIYGCHDAVTYTDYVVVHDVPDPMFYINPNPTTIFETTVDMNNITPGANNTYAWQFPGGTPSTSVVENPTVQYPEGQVADYPITLTVTNEWGCVASVQSTAHVLSDVILYAPNIFTPDGDEFNERWRVYIDGIDIYQFHLTMFNRWGEPVWESYNQTAEWNGTYGSGQIVPDGTYVWVIECREASTDKKYEFRGHVTVLK
jgi:gliding motility-associated-like protein